MLDSTTPKGLMATATDSRRSTRVPEPKRGALVHAIAACGAVLALVAGPAPAATLDGGVGGRPGGGFTPTAPPTSTPAPAPTPGSGRPGRGGIDVAGPLLPRACSTPAPIFRSCAPGQRGVDEVATRYFNTVLMRGCGRFVIHETPGNAIVEGTEPFGGGPIDPFGEAHRRQVPVRPDRELNDGINEPVGLPNGDRLVDLGTPKAGAWILALRGCGLEDITGITVSGTGVTAQVIDESEIDDFVVPLSPSQPPPSARGSGAIVGVKGSGPSSTAYVRFTAAASATTATDRKITAHFPDRSQELAQTTTMVARNGRAQSVQPASVRWEDEVRLRFTGSRIGNAALAGPECARRATIASSSETSLEIDARLYCPRRVVDPETGEATFVNQPDCSCAPIAYDRLLSIYTELDKQPFSYVRTNVAVEPNLDYLGEKPGAIGDSLSQGVYGIAVKPEAQLWAYPHLVVAQMGGSAMSQNLILHGPGPEDGIKSILPLEFGPAPDPIAELSVIASDGSGSVEFGIHVDLDIDLAQDRNFAFFDGQTFVIGGKSTRPLHTGISGMDYTNVLRTTGQCLDKTQSGLRPVMFFPAEESVEYNSAPETPDLESCGCPLGGPKPWPEVQLGLACGDKTPIEILEEAKPTFVFASAGANHFLSCAVHMKARDCVEMERFYRDSSEVFRRLRRIDTVRGGIVFGIPPVERIAYLVDGTAGPDGKRAFWKRDGEVDTAVEVLDAAEEDFLRDKIGEANEHLRQLALRNGYAFVDATEAFDRFADDGVPIVDPVSGETICRARPSIATETVNRDSGLEPWNIGDDAGCGMISLDGVHPNQLGHAIIADEMVKALNETYGVEIPTFTQQDLFEIWEQDTLNQDPVDMGAWLRDQSLIECMGIAAAEAGALGITGTACLTTGAYCVESFFLLLEAGTIPSECTEAAFRDLAVRSGFEKVDKTPSPQWCWGGVDEGGCLFENPDGESFVRP